MAAQFSALATYVYRDFRVEILRTVCRNGCQLPTMCASSSKSLKLSSLRASQALYELPAPIMHCSCIDAIQLDKEWLLMNNRRNIMVREPAVQITAALEKQRASRFLSGPPAHFVRGGPGVGKSCVLSCVVYWARKNGWLVVWIPSGTFFSIQYYSLYD